MCYDKRHLTTLKICWVIKKTNRKVSGKLYKQLRNYHLEVLSKKAALNLDCQRFEAQQLAGHRGRGASCKQLS